MGVLNRETREVHAKIVFYGASGAGTTTNLRYIQRKLKTEHRGELRVLRPREGAEETYEVLPVDLGSIRGSTPRSTSTPYPEERNTPPCGGGC